MAQFIIGLTGGIGSGKTTVSDQFKQLGIDVIDADVIAHQVTEKGQPALEKIAQHFSKEVLTQQGELNRAWLRKFVFSNPEEKVWLESLLHPLIGQAIISALDHSQSAYTLFVSPLLLKSQLKDLCQRIAVVDISVEQQLERTVTRDQCATQTVESIIKQQSSRQQRLDAADDIIDNSLDNVHLSGQVVALHKKYLELAHNLNN